MAERADAVRRSWPRPTVRGVALLIGGALLFVYGLFGERKDALFVGCFLLAVPVVAMGYVLIRRLKVHVGRTFSPPIVAAGTEAVVGLLVQNLSVRPSYGARWWDAAEPGIQTPDSTLLPSLGRHGRPDEADIARLEYTVTPRRRGVFGIGPLVLQRSDPFGLATCTQTTGEPHDLVVTPRVTELPGNALSLTSGDGSLHELVHNTHPNADELIAREYRPGDPLRRMNWPATARHGELMVRQEEQRSNPEARLLIDTDASGSGQALRGERRARLEAAFELALEMAASVGIHLLEAGFRVDVIELGPSQLTPGTDRMRGGLRGDTPTSYRIPAGDRDFLEGLANLRLPERAGGGGEPDVLGGVLRTGRTRLPAFAVLIDLSDADVRDLAALRPSCDTAVAFVLETVPTAQVERLEDAGWLCVRLRNPRGIVPAWEAATGSRDRVDEPV